MSILDWLSPVGSILKTIAEPITEHLRHRAKVAEAKADAEIAEIKAKAEIAGYKVKADIEWDLKWADQASTSYKDEIISMALMTPMVMLFIPSLAPYAVEGFKQLEVVLGEYTQQWYAGALTLVIVTTFGYRAAVGLLMPGRVAKMVTALSSAPDDIPDEIAALANRVAQEHMKDASKDDA